ncbi:hypothetical protein SteCoe_19927 [Stentor coeruleus]|uniref:HD domain-containing protein n=1 Tax=Stentor coeruleus TaxID=5963 RepID=A0A1R2BSZ6_9CILI|nr:hypothetical protein SteCoe_19927 [Stentor coeruleus]
MGSSSSSKSKNSNHTAYPLIALQANSISNIQSVTSKYVQNYIPSLLSNLQSAENILKENQHLNSKHERYESLVHSWNLFRNHMKTSEQEMIHFCQEEWEYENRVDDGLVCSHIIAVVIAVYVDWEFKIIDEHDKNVILWAALFHDVAKRGPPEMDTKDPFHPFTSASKALRIFSRLGWVTKNDAVEEAAKYINESFFHYKWGNFMDNSRLPMIYPLLLKATGLIEEIENFSTYREIEMAVPKEQLFVFEIVAIILFHQSFDFDPKYPNFTPLKYDEILKYTSPRLVKLVSIMHKGDNGSYNFPLPMNKWTFGRRIENTTTQILRFFK